MPPNPEIQPVPPLRLKDPPIPVRAVWKVYRLRSGGEKLHQLAVLNTEQEGVLTLWRSKRGDVLNARLTHISGYPVLENLDQVRVVRYDDQGLLLHGSVLNSKGGAVFELPQAWWCVLVSLGDGTGAASQPV